MSPHQTLIVVVRLISVAWILYILSQIGPVAAASEQIGIAPHLLWGFLGFQSLICIFLWLFPSSFASQLLRSGQKPGSVPASISDWQDLAFVAVGVFVLARAIPDVLYWVIFFVAAVVTNSAYNVVTLEQKISAFVTVIEIVLGLWLMFGSQGFRKLVFRLRYGNHGPTGSGG